MSGPKRPSNWASMTEAQRKKWRDERDKADAKDAAALKGKEPSALGSKPEAPKPEHGPRDLATATPINTSAKPNDEYDDDQGDAHGTEPCEPTGDEQTDKLIRALRAAAKRFLEYFSGADGN